MITTILIVIFFVFCFVLGFCFGVLYETKNSLEIIEKAKKQNKSWAEFCLDQNKHWSAFCEKQRNEWAEHCQRLIDKIAVLESEGEQQ